MKSRIVRNSACALFAMLLILLGFLKKARKKASQQDVIVPIVFHNPGKKLFRKTAVWLKKHGYTIISAEQLINILDKKTPFPRRAVWISLDDGWKGNLENVIPTAIKYDVPITIFVCTGAVEDGSYWWRKVRRYPQALPAPFQTVEAIRELPESQRKQIIKSLDQADLTFQREAMTVEDIRNMTSTPQVTIGAHTVNHPVLPKCDDDEIEYEFAESKKILESWTGKKVTTLAYPNGAYTGREKRFLESHGYELAATTENGFINMNSDRLFLPRNEIVDDGSFAENLCHIFNIWDPMTKKLKKVVRR